MDIGSSYSRVAVATSETNQARVIGRLPFPILWVTFELLKLAASETT
jgi:hypothetical protein